MTRRPAIATPPMLNRRSRVLRFMVSLRGCEEPFRLTSSVLLTSILVTTPPTRQRTKTPARCPSRPHPTGLLALPARLGAFDCGRRYEPGGSDETAHRG